MIMNKKHLIAAFALLALLAGACKSEYDAILESPDQDAKYKAAFEYFYDGKYQKAAQLFESLAMITSGTERDDTVQYFWGLSNYKLKDYPTAEANFFHFIQNYPRSTFSEIAQFLRVDCLYRATLRYELDQTPTRNTIASINEYLELNPRTDKRDICNKMLADLNERLDRKAFEDARIYYKMEDYKASRVALRNVLKDDSDNSHREEILYLTAMSSYKYAQLSVPAKQKERFLVFVDDYYNFIGEYPESQYRKELDSLYRKVKSK